MVKNTYIVYGKVQGVGFRRFAQRCAIECSVGGWVKNLSDGSVEIEAVGSPTQIASFIERISIGHWFSTVEEIEKTSSTVGQFENSTFSIIR